MVRDILKHDNFLCGLIKGLVTIADMGAQKSQTKTSQEESSYLLFQKENLFYLLVLTGTDKDILPEWMTKR
jgi:predicted transposase YbfD/YdcC